jgi:DNA-binding NtrC family response regulator
VQKPVLIVDDEDDTLFVFSRLLRRLDCCPVDAVRTLDDAAQAIRNRSYAVVVTDLRLTGAGGEEGLDILRLARGGGAATEVIVVTGYGSPASMTKAYQLGAAYYFEKPVQPAQLLEAVETLCRT